MPLPRLVSAGPRAALAAVERLSPSAVANARSAAAAIGAQVADRRQLDPDHAGDEPGALTRLTRAECLELLGSHRVGRLAYIARAGVPDIVPVNYALVGDDVLVRSGVGPKLQAAERGEVIALQVDDIDEQSRTGWSVVAAGPAQRLTPARVQALPPDTLPEAWATGPRHSVIRIRPNRVDGRRLQ